MKLKKMQAIVALDECGTGWIIARSDHITSCDLLSDCDTESNGFNDNWEKGLSVGVYLVTLEGWAHYDTMTGDCDAGVYVIDCVPLWSENNL